ncbi:hypothetical protein NVP1088O_88 [Vibrio phage 1.088.O._10N.261.46.A1]|nr:hypothetical protein NVP1088O_88 [Vibrio phage 1.088.O._10N.261.46.A1]
MKTLSDIKELLGLKPSHDYRNIFDHVQFLIRERDDALQLRKSYNSNVKDWRELCGYFNLPVSTLSDVLSEIDTMRKERDALATDLSTLHEQVETLKTDIEYERTQPQLSEIRYVLHGDIQPCSVLYSDDTTTLLRLDEGDIMCETDTIEWSDSVTYRCQELLKGESKRSNIPVTLSPVKLLAQLVRDERILLNDNGDDELGNAKGEPPCNMTQPATSVIPAPPPFGHEKPDHNNPYMHTNDLFTEKAMRNHGWTSEALVSCGHGHYVPVQHPADTER